MLVFCSLTSHLILFSLSLIQAQATWVMPVNMSTRSTMSFLRLKPMVTSHHGLAWPLPSCFIKCPATFLGLEALRHRGTRPALWTLVNSNVTCKQLGQSRQLSSSPASPWDTPRTLPLNSLSSGQCETMTTTQGGRKKNRKITKAAQTGTELFNELSRLTNFFLGDKINFCTK